MENRQKKDIDVGGTSDITDAEAFVEFTKVLNPRIVLDLGTGCYGKTAYLLRQYVEHKFRKYYGAEYLTIIGVEAYKKNYEYVKSLNLYDYLFNVEAIYYMTHRMEGMECLLTEVPDVIVCSHVLEHHTEEDGWFLLEKMYRYCEKGVILACPNGMYEHADIMNPYQNHKSFWTPEKIASKYPITTPVMSLNNLGVEQFILVIPT